MKLAILRHGTESEKERLSEIMNELQKQLNSVGSDEIEVVYRVNEEENIDEKCSWLLSQTVAPKYIFITAATIIEDNFIILRFNSVKLRKPTKQLLELGVFNK